MVCCWCHVTDKKPIVVQLNGMLQTADGSVDRIHFDFTNTRSSRCIFEDFVEHRAGHHNITSLVYRHFQAFTVYRPMRRTSIWQLNSVDHLSFVFADVNNIGMVDNVPRLKQSFHRDFSLKSQSVDVENFDIRRLICDHIQFFIGTRDSSDRFGLRQYFWKQQIRRDMKLRCCVTQLQGNKICRRRLGVNLLEYQPSKNRDETWRTDFPPLLSPRAGRGSLT